MSKIRRNKSGFTLVELMIALAFFSFILIFVLGGFLLITRNYNQGVTSSRIHQAGRNVLEEMVRELRESSTEPQYLRLVLPDSAEQAFVCYSGGTYRAWDKATNPTYRGQLRFSDNNLTELCRQTDPDSGEVFSAFDYSNSQAVVNKEEIVVTDLALEKVDPTGKLFRLSISLASANIYDDLGVDANDDDINESCSVATTGSEFCDTVTLSTTFSTR